MRRDFSEEYKQMLIHMIQENEEEKWSDLTDWIGDRLLDFGDWIGALDLYKYLYGVDAYTKKIIDKNNTSIAKIQEIFRQVYEVDDCFSSRINDEINAAIREYQNILVQMLNVISISGFRVENIEKLFSQGENLEKELQYIEKKNHYDDEVYKLLYDKEGKRRNIGEISDIDKDRIIEEYEAMDPALKNDMDTFIKTGNPNTLTDEDIRNIKFIAYTAEEPYKSIYLENIKNYNIGKIHNREDGGAYYSPDYDKIYIENGDNALENDPRGAYTTFFHESGHATDYNEGNPATFEFVFYSEKIGREVTLQEAIEYDVYNDIENQIHIYVSNDEIVERILNAFYYGNDVSELSEKERAVYDKIVSYYDNDLSGEQNEAACDVYGGVTNLKIDGKYGYGHRPGNGKSIDDYHYWYDSEGNATGRQSQELWAEYFSYCMTGDEEALESLRKHFPSACEILDALAKEMGENT